MAGCDFVIFAGFVWLIDGRGYQRYVKPLMIMGMNAIAVYMASELIETVLGTVRLKWRPAPRFRFMGGFIKTCLRVGRRP